MLDPSWAEFIVAYRQGGGTADGGGNLDTSKLGQGRNTIGSPLDLVGAAVMSLQSAGAAGAARRRGSGPTLKNPFTTDTAAMGQYLPQLFDNCTTVSGKAIPGRININQAPRTVLHVHSRHDLGFGGPDHFQSRCPIRPRPRPSPTRPARPGP